MSTHPSTIEAVFSAALEIASADERGAYLDRVCGGEVQLRERVEALLQANADAGSFLHHPPAGIDATTGAGIDSRDTSNLDSASAALPLLEPCDKPDRIGKLVGKVGEYEIIEIVGQGGMGTVLRAFDTKLSRVVAVKVMAPELAANAEAVKRFLREATTAAAVVHDHVVTIHAVDDSHRPPFLVMEYIDGQTLQQKIDREGALQLKTILRIGSQAAAGLAAAHKTGLIHRDVKPGNILLENGVERVKITDFGVARAADDMEMTKTGQIAGTPQYMSPEQAKGESIDCRSDLFSLGSVLYTMCAGRSAFRAETTMGVLKRVCEDEPRPIHEVNPEIPPWLEAIVGKLLAKDPTGRFQTAAEVAELLSQHLAHVQQPSLHPQPPNVVGAPASRVGSAAGQSADKLSPSRYRPWAIATAILLLLTTTLALAESTGITNVAATVIRIVRGDGTLVVEVDDPNVQILVDGEELVITGAGPKELRLRPGKHELQTVKDGKPADTKLVTITRDGREVVKVSREAGASTVANGPTVRQIAGVKDEGIGSISPDGRYQSYIGFPSYWETGDLAVRDLQTGESRALTNRAKGSGEFALRSVFSSDGKQIAYVWYNSEKFFDLRVVNLDGGSPRVVFRDDQITQLEPFAWSPNGNHILAAIRKQDKTSQLALVAIANGSVRVLGSKLPGHAVFSPDGRFVAYSDSQEIYVQAIEGGDEMPLVKHPARDGLLGWSPDGRWVLFSSDRRGATDAWAIPVAEGKSVGAAKLVKLEIGNILPKRFGNDGTFYYQTWSSVLSDVYTATVDVDSGQILAPPLNFSVHRTGHNSFAAWSPDGKSLAYFSRQYAANPQRSAMVIRNAETGQEREIELKTGVVHATGGSWSPDGRFIAYAGRQSIYRLDVLSGDVSPIVQPSLEALWPVWSPDGKSLYYILIDRRNDQRKTLRRDLETGNEEELVRTKVDGGTGLGIAVAPNGQHLAYFSGEEGADGRILNLLRIADRQVQELFRLPKPQSQSLRGPLVWSPDGRHLLFVMRGTDQETHTLWRVSVDQRKADKFDLSLRYLNNVGVHPDGKRIAFSAYSAQSNTNELWALENFLPPQEPEPQKAASAAEMPTPAARQVWANAADISGGPSADGRYLAFVDWETGDLAVRDLATGQNRRLTISNKGPWDYSSGFALAPRFSTDGRRLAYTWKNPQSNYELRVIGLDGGEPQVLHVKTATARGYPYPVAWMPNEESILAVLIGSQALEIALVPATPGSTRLIKSFPSGRFGLGNVCLSPDGRTVAYSRVVVPASANRNVFLLDVATGDETQLTSRAADENVLGWSPDGDCLVFAAARQQAWDAWALRLAGGKPDGNPILLKTDIGAISPLGMTREGKLYYGLDLSPPSIFTAALDLEKGTAIATPVPDQEELIADRSAMPAWSPDGEHLAYVVQTAGSPGPRPRIRIVSVKTGNTRVLEPDLGSIGNLRWSVDGRSFVSASWRRTPPAPGIHQIDADTSEVTTILDSPRPRLGPGRTIAVSPDGRGVYYRRDNGIVFHDFHTHQEREVVQPGNPRFDEKFFLEFDLSPDGKNLAVVGRETNSRDMILNVVAVDTGHLRELLRLDEGATRGPLAWAADGRSVLFIRSFPEDPQNYGLWQIPIAGGQPRKIDLPGVKGARDLAMHPNGTQFAFTIQKTRNYEVWALENFLPPLADSKPPPAADAKNISP